MKHHPMSPKMFPLQMESHTDLSQRTEAHLIEQSETHFRCTGQSSLYRFAFVSTYYNACSSCGAGITVLLFHPPWWSSFICPLWAQRHLGLVVSTISLAATLQDQTLNRRRKTTNIHIVLSNEISLFQQVHSSHKAQRSSDILF